MPKVLSRTKYAQHTSNLKGAAWILILPLLVSSVFQPQAYSAIGPEAAPAQTPSHPIDASQLTRDLRLPDGLGRIEEIYLGTQGQNSKIVFLLQNAHANFDSERNTKNLILWLAKEKSLKLVLLEGGAGSLERTLFKTFPNQRIQNQILSGYLGRSDLSGGEVAAILESNPSVNFFGIENLELYQKNRVSFLAARHEAEDAQKLSDKIEARLNKESSTVFSDLPTNYLSAWKDFHHNHAEIGTYSRTLKSIYEKNVLKQIHAASPSENGFVTRDAQIKRGTFEPFERKYPELAKVIALKDADSRIASVGESYEVEWLIKQFQKNALPLLKKSERMEASQMIQMYRIGQTRAGMLTLRLKGLAKEHNEFFDQTKQIEKHEAWEQTLSSLGAGTLAHAISLCEKDLRDTITRSKKEKTLLKDFYYLNLVRRFIGLEISSGEWSELRHCEENFKACGAFDSLSGKSSEQDALHSFLKPHFDFYKRAAERDQVLLQNSLSLIEKENASVSLLATGGFHTAGIADLLRKKGIAFAVLAPKISDISEEADRKRYDTVMRGERSFVKRNSSNLWDAFAKDFSAKAAESLAPRELLPTLKEWRGRVISDLIVQGKVTQASRFTRYIDSIAKVAQKTTNEDGFQIGDTGELTLREKIMHEVDHELSSYIGQIENTVKRRFNILSEGLRDLAAHHNFSLEALNNLASRVNAAASTSYLAQRLVLSTRSELRTESGASSDLTIEPLKPYEVLRQRREQNEDGARKIIHGKVLKENTDELIEFLFEEIVAAMPPAHLAAETVTPERSAKQVEIIYEMTQKFLNTQTGATQIEVVNPPGISHTEIYVVTQDRRELLGRLGSAIGKFGGNILSSYARMIEFERLPPPKLSDDTVTFSRDDLDAGRLNKPSRKWDGAGKKILVQIFEVEHEIKADDQHKDALGRVAQKFEESQFGDIQDAMRLALPALDKVEEEESGEIEIKVISNADTIVPGIYGLYPVDAEDAIYGLITNIYVHLNPNAFKVTAERSSALKRDLENFEVTIKQLAKELPNKSEFSNLLGRDPNQLAGMIRFLDDLISETHALVLRSRPRHTAYRRDAGSFFYELMIKKVISKKEREKVMRQYGIAKETLEALSKMTKELWINQFSLDSKSTATSKSEVNRFTAALDAELSKGMREVPEDAQGAILLLDGRGDSKGLRQIITDRIKSGADGSGKTGLTALGAILSEVIPFVQALEIDAQENGDLKRQALATEISLLFTRVVQNIQGKSTRLVLTDASQPDANLILFADRADPYNWGELKNQYPQLTAVVLRKGSIASHTAGILKGLGISLFVVDSEQSKGMDWLHEELIGCEVILDGKNGVLMINPSVTTREKFTQRISEDEAYRTFAQELPHPVNTTVFPLVKATVEDFEQAQAASLLGARGIGLYRTEYQLLKDPNILTNIAVLVSSTNESDRAENENKLVEYAAGLLVKIADATEGGEFDVRLPDISDIKDNATVNPNKKYGPDFAKDKFGRQLYQAIIKAALLANLRSKNGNIRILIPIARSPEQLLDFLRKHPIKKKGMFSRERKNLVNLTVEEQKLLDSLALEDATFMRDLVAETKATVLHALRQEVSTKPEVNGEANLVTRVKKIPLGFMIEQPEHIHILNELINGLEPSFFNFGLSDLTLHAFRELKRSGSFFKKTVYGISRVETEDNSYFKGLKPETLLLLIEGLAKLKNTDGTMKLPVSLCGGLANLDAMVLFLMHHDFRVSISVPPDDIAERVLFTHLASRAVMSTTFFDHLGDTSSDLNALAGEVVTKIKRDLMLSAAFEKRFPLLSIQENIETDGKEKETTSASQESKSDLTEIKIDGDVATHEYFIGNSLGIHARPSSFIVQFVKQFNQKVSEVKIWKDESPDELIDMSSVMDLVTLGASAGTKVVVQAKFTSEIDVHDFFAQLEKLEENGEAIFVTSESQVKGRAELRGGARILRLLVVGGVAMASHYFFVPDLLLKLFPHQLTFDLASRRTNQIYSRTLRDIYQLIKGYETQFNNFGVPLFGEELMNQVNSLRLFLEGAESRHISFHQAEGGDGVTQAQIEIDSVKTAIRRAFVQQDKSYEVLLKGLNQDETRELSRLNQAIGIERGRGGKNPKLAGEVKKFVESNMEFARKLFLVNLYQQQNKLGIIDLSTERIIDNYLKLWRPGKYVLSRLQTFWWKYEPLFGVSADGLVKRQVEIGRELAKRNKIAAKLDLVHTAIQKSRNRMLERNWSSALYWNKEAQMRLNSLLQNMGENTPGDLVESTKNNIHTDLIAISTQLGKSKSMQIVRNELRSDETAQKLSPDGQMLLNNMLGLFELSEMHETARASGTDWFETTIKAVKEILKNFDSKLIDRVILNPVLDSINYKQYFETSQFNLTTTDILDLPRNPAMWVLKSINLGHPEAISGLKAIAMNEIPKGWEGEDQKHIDFSEYIKSVFEAADLIDGVGKKIIQDNFVKNFMSGGSLDKYAYLARVLSPATINKLMVELAILKPKPMNEISPQVEKVAIKAATETASPIHILLVEDESSISDLAKMVLEPEGYLVTVVENGTEALSQLNQSVDLVITDLNLPGINGLKLAEKIRTTNPQIPIILYTGGEQPEGVKSLGLGFLQKPFDNEVMVTMVKEQLQTAFVHKILSGKLEGKDISRFLAKFNSVHEALKALNEEWKKTLATLEALNEDNTKRQIAQHLVQVYKEEVAKNRTLTGALVYNKILTTAMYVPGMNSTKLMPLLEAESNSPAFFENLADVINQLMRSEVRNAQFVFDVDGNVEFTQDSMDEASMIYQRISDLDGLQMIKIENGLVNENGSVNQDALATIKEIVSGEPKFVFALELSNSSRSLVEAALRGNKNAPYRVSPRGNQLLIAPKSLINSINMDGEPDVVLSDNPTVGMVRTLAINRFSNKKEKVQPSDLPFFITAATLLFLGKKMDGFNPNGNIVYVQDRASLLSQTAAFCAFFAAQVRNAENFKLAA